MAIAAGIKLFWKNHVLSGYCTYCKRRRRVIEVSTEKMPNGSYLHTGKCLVCRSRIFKKIKEGDMVEIRRNIRVPQRIFMGARTSKRLLPFLEKGEQSDGTLRI
jgi:hypothetical protein